MMIPTTTMNHFPFVVRVHSFGLETETEIEIGNVIEEMSTVVVDVDDDEVVVVVSVADGDQWKGHSVQQVHLVAEEHQWSRCAGPLWNEGS